MTTNNKYPTWIIRAVCPCVNEKEPVCDYPVLVTNGMTDYCEYELELNIPVNIKQGQDILNLVSYNIAENKVKPEHNLKVDTIFQLPFCFVITEPIHKTNYYNKVYRIILCDKNGYFPWDNNCDPIFKKQLGEI